MSARDVVLLIVGAVLGVCAQQSYEWLARRYRRAVSLHRSGRRHRGQLALRQQTLTSYEMRGLEGSLYRPVGLGSNNAVPLLATSLAVPRTLDLHSDSLFAAENTLSSFPVNRRRISRLEKSGAVVFDGQILHVTAVETDGTQITKIRLRSCGYLSYASQALHLQAKLRNGPRRRGADDRRLETFTAATSGAIQPQGLGCVCVTLFSRADELHVAVASRSQQVFIDSGLISVLPDFGAETNVIGDERSRYSLLAYNFLREFAEEFFDLEELIHMGNARRIHPDWILSLPVVQAVTREADKGRLNLEVLGLAVNPADGALICAILAWFQSEQYFRNLTTQLRANWESSGRENGQPPIQFLPLYSPLLDKWADEDLLAPDCAWALDLARTRMQQSPHQRSPGTARRSP